MAGAQHPSLDLRTSPWGTTNTSGPTLVVCWLHTREHLKSVCNAHVGGRAGFNLAAVSNVVFLLN